MIKQLLFLTLIPAATHAAEKAAFAKKFLQIGEKICEQQKKIESSIYNTSILTSENANTILPRLPKELLIIIAIYQLPTMPELHNAACDAIDHKTAITLCDQYGGTLIEYQYKQELCERYQ